MISTQLTYFDPVQSARRWIAAFTVVAVAILMAAPGAMSAAIAQGYASTEKLPAGTLAALKTSQSNEVVAANTELVEGIVGVVVEANDATLALNPEGPIQVATSGLARVFVTDLAGDIEAGDKITASPLSGVGMKATGSSKIVGTARQSFDAGKGTETVNVTSRDGKSRQVKVGVIEVQVQVGYYVEPQEKTIIPIYLQQFSNAIAGKQVSPFRIIGSTLVLMAAVLAVTVILFSAVRSSILSIGRNPLAKAGIYQGLLQAVLTSVVILAIGVGSTYLILRT